MKLFQTLVVCVVLVGAAPLWAQGIPQGEPSVAPDLPPVELAPPAVVTPPSEIVPDQPALPTTEVPSPAAPDHSGDQVMWALIASYFLNHLKRTAWFPYLSERTTSQVKAIWGFGLAVLTAFGVNVAVSGSVFNDTGMALTITGISWKVFKDVVWQWAAQQGAYDLIVRRGLPLPAAPPSFT